MSFRSFFRRLDQRRRASSFAPEQILYKFLGRDRTLEEGRLLHAEIRTILILRNNKRIGNMYFTIPFVRELRKAYPKATLDLLLINSGQASIFNDTGVDNVLISNFSFKTPTAFIQAIQKYKDKVYDMIIMPYGSNTDILIGGLLHARNKVTFYNKRSHFVYPHSYQIKPSSRHMALGSLSLIEALGNTVSQAADHTMVFTQEEIAQGKRVYQEFKGNSRLCFAYFRGARGTKIISDIDWINIRNSFDQATNQSIEWIEILSPDIRETLLPHTRSFSSSDLRQLAAVLKEMDLFICGDTGPLHLADAANARCVGIFTATNPEQFGCLGPNTVNVKGLEQLDARKILRTLNLLPGN